MTDEPTATLAQRIDAIEEAYEFMLAYAAQGREDDHGPGQSVRDFLHRAVSAIEGLAAAAAAEISAAGKTDPDWAAFADLLKRDADEARTAMRLVLIQPAISSALIDNLNASIHVRTLLTDLFLIDEALKARAR